MLTYYPPINYYTHGGRLSLSLRALLRKHHAAWFLFVVLLVLSSCAHRIPVPVPTFDDVLFQHEGVRCVDLIQREDGAPVPDCKTNVDALTRGRIDATAVYPGAAAIKFSAVSLWATRQVWNAVEDFPRMPTGAMALTLSTAINYAFGEALEHEFVHAAVFLLDGMRKRDLGALEDEKDIDQKQLGFAFFYQIVCHNTTDDPFGHGLSLSASGRAGCIKPYSSGPKNPLKP